MAGGGGADPVGAACSQFASHAPTGADSAGDDRPFPHNLEAERSVLGAILIENRQIDQAHEILTGSDFYREGHRTIFRIMAELSERHEAIDLITLTEELHRKGKLESVGGASYVSSLLDGVPHSANVEYYARIVRDKARRRRIAELGEGLQRVAFDGGNDAEIASIVAELSLASQGRAYDLRPATLKGLVDQDTGKVSYLATGLLPKAEITLVVGRWKAGKSLVVYQLILDVLRGQSAFGSYPVPEPFRVALFQFEMPEVEDVRRWRRLALGAGLSPDQFLDFVRRGTLTPYNRPLLNLARAEDVARFHAAVRACGAHLVVVDSILAAFAGEDLNDNSHVRSLLSRAFDPLTSRGVTILALHHPRKGQRGGGKDDDRDAMLGAQAFGASAGRVYTLERLGISKNECDEGASAFNLRLSLTGSWTPEESPDAVLRVEDTKDGGTVVRVLREAEQVRRGGVTVAQRAALAFRKLARDRKKVSRKDAFEVVMKEVGCQDTSAKNGLKYATDKGWVNIVDGSSGKDNEKDLVPGPHSDEV